MVLQPYPLPLHTSKVHVDIRDKWEPLNHFIGEMVGDGGWEHGVLQDLGSTSIAGAS